jgi:hypothetical protein
MHRYAENVFERNAVAYFVDANVIDQVREIAEFYSVQTIFTRFVPPRHPTDVPELWEPITRMAREPQSWHYTLPLPAALLC